MKNSDASMKTPGAATPGSESISVESTFVKKHPEIGILIWTLQSSPQIFPDADGDDLYCSYNGLMFPEDFMTAVGTSRRNGLVKTMRYFGYVSKATTTVN